MIRGRTMPKVIGPCNTARHFAQARAPDRAPATATRGAEPGPSPTCLRLIFRGILRQRTLFRIAAARLGTSRRPKRRTSYEATTLDQRAAVDACSTAWPDLPPGGAPRAGQRDRDRAGRFVVAPCPSLSARSRQHL